MDFLDAQIGDEHFLTTTRKIKVKVSGCVYSLKGINQNHQKAHVHVHTDETLASHFLLDVKQ